MGACRRICCRCSQYLSFKDDELLADHLHAGWKTKPMARDVWDDPKIDKKAKMTETKLHELDVEHLKSVIEIIEEHDEDDAEDAKEDFEEWTIVLDNFRRWKGVWNQRL